ncbi:hypothetical protein FBU30_008637 [Linnemannia zychae]|nr:hypothetical protein FBU30_008637 [Linnemannia zychae]
MVAVSSGRWGLVLSLCLSASLFSSSTAQVTGPVKPTGTATGGPAPTGTSTPQPPVPAIDAPNAYTGIASTSTKNFIYYQGGQLNQPGNITYTAELYALDVTKPWQKSNPAWINLTKPTSGAAPQVGGHSAAMSPDGGSILVTAPWGDATKPFLYIYNIASTSWSTVNAPGANAASWTNRKNADLVTDPASGTTYLLGGSSAVDSTSTNEIDSYKNGDWTPQLTVNAATAGAADLNWFNSGTSVLFNSKIYIFGGFSSSVGKRGYQSFQSLPYIDISTNPPTHGVQFALGNFPGPRQDHCTVLTDSKKVLLFGGYDANTKLSLADLWSLDMITMTWTQILATNPTKARHGHTCSIIGANMIVFGGLGIFADKTQAYQKDVQIYDVMLSKWMTEYAPKADNTAISDPPSGSNNSSSSGLSTGALVGIVIGAVVVVGLAIGGFLYRRRQKQIEIKEAEMEKEAYLASLRPEGEDSAGKDSKLTPRHSPNTARALGMSTPGMSHNGAYAGMDEILLNNAAGSPGMGGQGQSNVQYLMQHLPDGTIAVQPVYLDHSGSASQMQSPSPSAQAMTLSPSPLDHGYISPPATAVTGGYFPPPGSSNVASPVTSPYVLPPTAAGRSNQGQDPFASPTLANAPIPPGYSNPSGGVSGLSSPQQMHSQHAQY